MRFYEYINETLKAYGCRKAFGVPGKLVMPIWQNLDGIEIVLCSHEQEASYAATGYSKASGELVAVVTIGSPGVTNCASGIASANMDSVPMVYISGRTPSRLRGYGLRQEESNINRAFNSVDLLSPLTKKQIEINDISQAAQMFSNACEEAISGRQGCVHVSIDMEIQSQELPLLEKFYAAEKSMDAIVPTFPNVTKPLIILGWGCWQAKATTKVYELAEKIGAPVLVTSKASCCIWGKHPNYLGKLGYGYNAILEGFLQDYSPEQVLVFGSSMGRKDISESCLSILQRAETYLYSIECEDVVSRFSDGHWVQVNDMAEMVDSWLKETEPSNDILAYDLKSVRQQQKMFYLGNIESKDLMAQAVYELNNLCDDSCVIAADAGNHLIDTAILYEPQQLGGMFLDVGIRSMGSSICSSVGMALASKNKYYVAVTGDGSMLMNGNVMYLAKRYDLPVLFLVINNSSHGRVRVGQMMQKNFISTDLGNIDFTLYGKAYGLDTYKAKSMDEYRNVMERILSERRTSLLELCTDKDEIPPSLKGDRLY